MSISMRLAGTAGFILAAVLAAPGCARQPAAPKLPEAAYAPLAEDEFARFAGALPAAVAALKSAGFEPDNRPNENIPAGIARIVGGMEKQSGVAESLAAHQTDWAAFSTTMYKVMSAAAAIAVDMAAAADSLKDNSLTQKNLSDDRAFADKVPQDNRDFVINHQEKLLPLSRLGDN